MTSTHLPVFGELPLGQVSQNSSSAFTRAVVINRLNQGRHNVSFYTVDGQFKRMVCTLDPTLIPAHHLPKKVAPSLQEVALSPNPLSTIQNAKPAKPVNESILHVFAVCRDGWRTIKISNIVDIQ